MSRILYVLICTGVLSLSFYHTYAQVTVTKQDTLIYDANSNLLANPGDSLRYKVNVKNPGAGDIIGATMDVNPSSNLGPATNIRTTPVAVNDTFDVTANVGISVPAGSGLKINDFDDNLGLAAIQVQVNQPTAMGGTVSVNADGSFTYMPAAGFTGADNFIYVLQDGNTVPGCPPTNDAIVLLNVSSTSMIWFIDNAGGGSGGTGTLTDPFKTLADFNASSGPQPGNTVFIEHTGSNYPGGIVLEDNQILWGTGHTGGSNLADIVAEAPFSLTLPPINGTRPVIENAAGDGVTLASGNALRGFNVGNSSDFGMDNTGTNSIGNLAVSEVSIINTTGGGFDASNGTGATMNAVFTAISSAGGSNGINLNTAAGTFNAGTGSMTNPNGIVVNIVGGTVGFTYSGSITQANNFAMVSVSGGHTTGTVTFQTGTLSATNGTGLQFDNADSPMSYNFNGTTTLNGGDAGIDITNNSGGTFTFSSNTSINNPTGIAYREDASTATVTYNGTITKNNNANHAIDINAKTGGVTAFNGAIVASTTTAHAIDLTNTGGTVNFTGGLNLATSTGTGFNASGAGATISATQNNTSILNTINSIGGTALNVVNTTIGMANMTFRSISSSGATNGIVLNTTGTTGGLTVVGNGADGSGGTIQNITQRGASFIMSSNVMLKDMTFTNANTSDEAACIAMSATNNQSCYAAIHLANVTNATLNNVDINGTSQNGINVYETSGLHVLNSTVTNTGTGGQPEEGGLYALNLSDTASINNSIFSLPGGRAAVIYNSNETLDMDVVNSQFNDTQTSAVGADGFEMTSFGTSVTDLNITNCTFLRDKTNGIQFLTENTATGTVDITGCTIDPQAGVGAGMDLASNGTSVLYFNVNGNPNIKSRGTSVINCFSQGSSTMEGQVNNNVVSSLGGSGFGIRAVANVDGDMKIKITNNTVSNIALDGGILAVSRLGVGRMDATITGNNVTILPTATYNIETTAGASSSVFTNKTCANVANNTVSPAVVAGMPLANYQARSATPTHELLLEGPSPITNYWNSKGNMPTFPTALVQQVGTGVFTYNATCLLPSYP